MKTGSYQPTDVIELLLAFASLNRDVTAFQFAFLDYAPLADARSQFSSIDRSVATLALEHRAQLRLPFWDGVMLAASHSSAVPTGLLEGAAFHQRLAGKLSWVSVDRLNPGCIGEMIQLVHNERRLLALTSLVQLRDGGQKHIPMLDFHIANSDHATNLTSEVIQRMEMTGMLLNSGKSYHFYGDTLLSNDELRTFLGKALFYGPIVDRAWIAHQLIEGCCALRISPRAEYGGVPRVVKYVGPRS